MEDAGEMAAKQLREITECPICMSAFNDPRMLPCIHTFCFQCLKSTAEGTQVKPGDKMPCPLCRKEFHIPKDGVNGVQKNFFMKNLIECQTTLQMGSVAIVCDICNASDEGKTEQIPKATMRCLECQDNYCDRFLKVHQFQKLSRNHQLVKIGSDIISGNKKVLSVKCCIRHTQKPLDYYCADCKKIVCVSCFVESHKLHDCKDVATVHEEFRQTIEKILWKTSNYADELLSMRKNKEKRKTDFLQIIQEKEHAIQERYQELKDAMDRDTKSLFDALSVINSNHLKQIEIEMQEIDRCSTLLRSYKTYCTELKLKGSASDICNSVDELVIRADELERDHEAFIGRPCQSVEVSFKITDLKQVLQKYNNNVVGNIQAKTESVPQLENYAVVVGLKDMTSTANNVVKVNLHRSNKISVEQQVTTIVQEEATAAVYCNTMYVIGIGAKRDDIWKYNMASGWMRCASLVQGRRRHSAAFINEVLYICGGFVDSNEEVLDSVEAYNAITDKCASVGKLINCFQDSGNCVPFRSSLYIFGGFDQELGIIFRSLYNILGGYRRVQMYNTKDNTCTLLSEPMPWSNSLMRAALFEKSVILLGHNACFIFDFETEAWREREQFKADVRDFGLVLENERIFVIGGETWEDDNDEIVWKCRDDVRSVPLRNIIENKSVEWKIHGKLPEPCLVHACAKIRLPV